MKIQKGHFSATVNKSTQFGDWRIKLYKNNKYLGGNADGFEDSFEATYDDAIKTANSELAMKITKIKITYSPFKMTSKRGRPVLEKTFENQEELDNWLKVNQDSIVNVQIIEGKEILPLPKKVLDHYHALR